MSILTRYPLIILLILFSYTPLYSQNLHFIVNKNVEETRITSETVRNIYLGKKTKWNNGNRIVLVIMQEHEIHDVFLKTYIKKGPHAFLNYWRQILFTGKGVPPISFDDETELIHYVSATKNAIGYVSNSEELDDVKILTIIE